MERLGPMSEAMYVPSVRRAVALACAVAALASVIAASPAAARGTPNTAALQVALKALHHYQGGIDGINGRRTKLAVRRYQRAHRLPVDGVAGPRTRRKLGDRGRPSLGSRAMTRGDRGWDVAGLQWLLRKRGFRPNGTDGGFGANTEAAVRRAQSEYGLGVDGVAGNATVGALKRGRAPRRSQQGGGGGGTATGPVRFLRPVRASVTSPFGMRWGRMHTGIDFGALSGTPVGAGGRGVVSFAGWNAGGYGNLVVIDHRLGFQSWYAHLSSVAVSPGQTVNGGTTIGNVGATGHVTGPHLHFEVRTNGTPVDPAPYLLSAYAKRARVVPEHDDAPAPLDGCVPPGLPDSDPATARLIDCH